MVNKKSLMHYMGDTTVPFLRITLSDQRSLPKIRDKLIIHSPAHFNLLVPLLRLFDRGEVRYKDFFQDSVNTYESNIAYTLRFMIDAKVSYCVPGKYY